MFCARRVLWQFALQLEAEMQPCPRGSGRGGAGGQGGNGGAAGGGNSCENPPGQGSTSCTSAKLWPKLGGQQVGYQPHHIIPCAMRNRFQVITIAEGLGYDINGKNNGIALPTTVAESKRTGLPLHSGGPLNIYMNCVNSLLSELQTKYENSDALSVDLCEELRVIENKLKNALKTHQIWIQAQDPNIQQGQTPRCP